VNIAARIVSFLFHPLLMATYLFSLLSFTLPFALDPIQLSGQLNFILLIFIMTFALPVFNFIIFKMIGSMRSLTMEKRSERFLPFSFITILYIGVTYLFYTKSRVGLHDNVMKLLVIIDLLVFAATVITFFYKVSVHSLAIWGLLGILLPLNKVSEDNALLIPTLSVVVIAGLVMSSRLQLQSHSPREILVGTMVGFATSFTAMIVFF
jgi:hypothetical protein